MRGKREIDYYPMADGRLVRTESNVFDEALPAKIVTQAAAAKEQQALRAKRTS